MTILETFSIIWRILPSPWGLDKTLQLALLCGVPLVSTHALFC